MILLRCLLPAALVLGLIAGCASGPPRQTTVDVTRASTLVSSAESSSAQQFAAADLQAARDKVQEAQVLESKNPERADQLANEAAVDAELASARAQDAQAQHALADLHRSLKTLRSEAERNVNTPPAGTAPSGTVEPLNETVPQSGTPPSSTAPPPRTSPPNSFE